MWLLCRRWTRHGWPPCSWYHVWSCWRLDSSTCTAQSSACCPRPRCATRWWWSPTRFLDSGKVTWRLRKNLFSSGLTFAIFDILSLFPECSAVFHKGGARLILCGKSWEKLEELADDLEKTSDPTKVRGKQGEGLTLTVKSTMFTDAAGDEAHIQSQWLSMSSKLERMGRSD